MHLLSVSLCEKSTDEHDAGLLLDHCNANMTHTKQQLVLGVFNNNIHGIENVEYEYYKEQVSEFFWFHPFVMGKENLHQQEIIISETS